MNNKNSRYNHSNENLKDTSPSKSSENTSPSKSSENTSSNTSSADTSSTSSNILSDINSSLSEPLSAINNINSLKSGLCELPLDPCEQKFISNNITPLLSTLETLARTSYDLSYSVNILTNSPIVKPKRHELKDTIHTIYDINDQCEDIYEVIEKRINIAIKGKR
ncbi:MAG: hypothetical protein Q8900_09655 [Bacillota bacterium]|nr:hypothetical protein [Bacillota bacterium]